MKRYSLLIIGSIVTIVLDQASKIWAVKALALPDGVLVEGVNRIPTRIITVFESWFHFRLTGNRGAAWGIFSNLPDGWRVPFFVLISVIAIGAIVVIYHKSPHQPLLRWALTLVLGGAIGNLIDRIRLGFVIDFIDWHYLEVYHWPTFNVADVAISVGVGLLILDMIVNRGQGEIGESTTPDNERTHPG